MAVAQLHNHRTSEESDHLVRGGLSLVRQYLNYESIL